MSFRKVGRVTSAGDSVDKLPDEPTVDSTQSSPGRRTDWDEVTVFPGHRLISCAVKQSLTTPPVKLCVVIVYENSVGGI